MKKYMIAFDVLRLAATDAALDENGIRVEFEGVV